MAAQKLTLKQKRFVTEYVRTGNATQAAQLAGYKEDNNASLRSIGWENLTKPDIVDAIEQALTKSEITPEWVTNQFKQIATATLSKPSDRLKALENLAKIIELTGFRQPESVKGTTINGDITISFGQPVNSLPKPIDSNDYTIIDSQ